MFDIGEGGLWVSGVRDTFKGRRDRDSLPNAKACVFRIKMSCF
jgi:hypothetical protein